MKIRAIVRYFFTLIRTAIIRKRVARDGKYVEKGVHLYAIVGNITYIDIVESTWRFLKKLEMKLLYDLVIPLLVIYPKNLK